jgi:hypothetical protein
MKSRLFLTCLLICCAAGLIGQSARDAYRQYYDAWRQAQANLERDAGAGGTAVVAQADRAAAAESTFAANRAAYLKSAAQDAAQRRQLLQAAAASPSKDLAPATMAQLVGGELQTVTRTVARFATDKDRGIQQLSQALERERDALTALNESIQARSKTVAATSVTVAALEQARVKTAGAFGEQASQASAAAAGLEKERAAWADYYEKLAQAIQVANAPPPPPVTVTSAAPRNDSAPPVPLARYVGAWTYPTVNGIFHGPQPDFVDLVVHEQNGHADGTLFGRFKVSAGGPSDPLVRFDFQGDFGSTMNQRFTVVSNDGTRGTIELIPGPAFNLLEVNFQTDLQPNKIRAGNFILVKK